MGLKAYLEKIEPNFEPGGKHEKWYALYEAAATIFFLVGVAQAQGCPKQICDIPRGL